MRCIIVDDEFPAREELKYFIKKNPQLELIAEFENAMEAFDYLQDGIKKTDVLFLDINMPEINGLNLAKILKTLDKDLKIVFVTAYREYAVDAFEIEAFDYLLKPYSEERIEHLLERLSEVEQPHCLDKISIPLEDKIVIVSLSDISVVEANKRETHIYTKEACYISKMKISDWEEILDKKKFYRCHRSYIIQLSKVKELETWFHSSFVVHMEDCPISIPISRANIKEFKMLFHMK